MSSGPAPLPTAGIAFCAHELSNQDRIGLVVSEVVVVGSLRVVVERREITLIIQSAAQLERESRPLGIPCGLFMRDHWMRTGRPISFAM